MNPTLSHEICSEKGLSTNQFFDKKICNGSKTSLIDDVNLRYKKTVLLILVNNGKFFKYMNIFTNINLITSTVLFLMDIFVKTFPPKHHINLFNKTIKE